MVEIDTDNLIVTINQYVKKFTWLDFEVQSYKDGNILVLGSTDFSYYHQIEISFYGVSFYQGVLSWGSDPSDDLLVENTTSNLSLIDEYKLNGDFKIYSFITDDETKVNFAAERISINTDTVFYYQRDNLKENE